MTRLTHARLAGTLVALAAVTVGASAQATTLSASANSAATALGGTAAITVTLNLSDPVDLLGFTFNADWSGDTGLALDAASGSIAGQSVASFAALFDPSFTVLTLDPQHFGVALLQIPAPTSLPAGNSTLSFQVVGLAPGVHTIQYELSLTDPNFNDIAAPNFSSTVAVSAAVPENSPALMLAAGIAVLGLLARRRSH